jgi:hypothetical protein
VFLWGIFFIQGVARTTVQRLSVDAGPKGLPEKAIWTDPIFNRGGVDGVVVVWVVFGGKFGAAVERNRWTGIHSIS